MAGEFRIFSMESSRVAVDAGSATVGHPDTPFPLFFYIGTLQETTFRSAHNLVKNRANMLCRYSSDQAEAALSFDPSFNTK